MEASDLQSHLNGNQIPHIDRGLLKRMVNAGQWDELGRLFRFNVVYMKGSQTIDWRCVPQRLYSQLQQTRHKVKHDFEAGFESRSDTVDRTYSREKPQRHLAKVPRSPLAPKGNERVSRRELLYCQQSAMCHYCNGYTPFNTWTIDHLIPTSRGGSQIPSNLVGSCLACNNSKGPLTYVEFMETDFMGGKKCLFDALRDVNRQINPQSSVGAAGAS